jgi:hypothetical protein
MKRLAIAAMGAITAWTTAGCQDGMTVAEAREAVTEASVSSQASDLTSASIDITTSFTIGQGVQAAANEIKTFIESQLPCADIQLANATLTIVYGAKPGMCFYRGHQFSGKAQVTVTKDDMGDVIVDHVWTDLSNGLVKVSGTAHVTWSLPNASRHVQHELTWTRITDGRTGKGTGDRTQTALPEGIAVGMQIDGMRTWDGPAGHWDLSIQAVQVRWADPVPQSGKYTLVTPKGKSASMTFTRIDDDTIQVTVSSARSTFKFNVHRAIGEVQDAPLM